MPKVKEKNRMCNACGKEFQGHHLRKWCNDCRDKVSKVKIPKKEKKKEVVVKIVKEEKPEQLLKELAVKKIGKNEIDFKKREEAKQRCENQRLDVSSREVVLKDKLKQLYKAKEELQRRLKRTEELITETNAEFGKAGFARNCFGVTYHDNDPECQTCSKNKFKI